MSEQTGGLPSPRSPDQEQRRVERERAWATAIADGDESAFESVFLAYYDRLHLFALRFVRSPDVAEELVGTVFLRLWEQRTEREIRESLRSYLYTAVRNRALMYLEHREVVRRVHDSASRAQESPGMGQTPPSALEELQPQASDTIPRAVLGRSQVGRLEANGMVSLSEDPMALERHLAWTGGRLAFQDAPLVRVFRDLERWYGAKLRAGTQQLGSELLTLSIKGGDGRAGHRSHRTLARPPLLRARRRGRGFLSKGSRAMRSRPRLVSTRDSSMLRRTV